MKKRTTPLLLPLLPLLLLAIAPVASSRDSEKVLAPEAKAAPPPTVLGAALAAAEASVVKPPAPEHFLAGEWNLDLYGTGSIANESRSASDVVLGGGAGLNYWITRGLGIGLRGETDNWPTGFGHSFFDRTLGRVSVRAPLWDRIAPYGYAEGGYHFEHQRWLAGTGAGLDLRMAKGWGFFFEAGLQTTTRGAASGKGEGGVRLCW